MKRIEYFKIIHKYIRPDSLTYSLYIPHVSLVTVKSIRIAEMLCLSNDKLRFIEEAAMLHDIGIIKVNDEELGCNGKLNYLCHGTEGRKILEAEKLMKHAEVAENHTGVGIFKDEIENNKLPLPKKDIVAVTLEEEIISYADLFFSKNPQKIWHERSIEEARASIEKFGKRHIKRFKEWVERFER